MLALAASLTAAAPAPVPVALDLAKRGYVDPCSSPSSSLTHGPRPDHSEFNFATVFLQEGGTGSCGQANPDSAYIAAVSNDLQLGQSPGPMCGKQITIRNIGSNDGVGGIGNSVTVTVADTCPSCDQGHLDLSVAAWNQLTNNAPYGTVNIDGSVHLSPFDDPPSYYAARG